MTTTKDKAQDKEQAPELCIHDMDSATCAECNGAAAREDQEGEAPEADPEPEQAKATWDAGEYQLPQFRPVVTGPDGARYECKHHWGHGDERSARKCAGSLAGAAGLSL